MTRPSDDIMPYELARQSVEAFIRQRIVIEPPANPEGILATRSGVFVTLRKSGELRGCIGTIEAEQANVAQEIIRNAVSAATRDPRFPAVNAGELSDLSYSVDVLSTPEPARGPEDLDPAVYGIIVETLDGARRGLLLPRIAGLESVEEQWAAAHAKAGISPGSPVRVERFTVTRFGTE